MDRSLRDNLRLLFHRVLFHPMMRPIHGLALRAVRRIQAHLLNCSTSARANGEEWLIGQLPDEGRFLDVGFNRGSWTQLVLERGSEIFVDAFDPCRESVDCARQMDFSDRHFAFHNIALSNEIGTATFFDYGNMNESNSLVPRSADLGSNAEAEEYEVEVTTLDQWRDTMGNPFIDVLKVDAEGFDLHVLEGARESLDAQQIDLIVFEYASGWFASKRSLYEATRYLADRGYVLYRLFPFFLAPYEYRIQHEGQLTGYFVALSRRRNETNIPRRRVDY